MPTFSSGGDGDVLDLDMVEVEDTNTASADNNTDKAIKRGPRTIIKAEQLEMLMAAFIANPKPTKRLRDNVAVETGLPMRVVQV